MLALLLRTGLRNMLRRPQQTALIVIGLALSTLLITASIGLGDSYGSSQSAAATAQVGNVVSGITSQDPNALIGAAEAAQIEAGIPGPSAGVVALTSHTALYDERTKLVSAENSLLAAPPELDAVWGPLATPGGGALRFASLQPGDIYISPTLARWVHGQAGDQVLVFVNGKPSPFTVRAVLADTIDPTSSGISLSLAMPLASYQQLTGQPGAVTAVYTSASIAGAPPGYALHHYRQDALGQAQSAGSVATALVLAISALMIGAGLLLIHLILVVLVAERRRELGMARAVGMGRRHLTLGLVLEGAGYGLVAGALGVIGGAAVAWLLARLLNGGHSIFYGQVISIQFHMSLRDLLVAFALGFALSLAVVAISAWRVSRLQVVAAIRNLPEAETARGRGIRRAITTVLGVAAVGLGLLAGSSSSGAAPYAAPLIVLLGAILLLVAYGELLARALLLVLGGIPGLAPVGRTAMSYPLSNRFRTGLTITMFSVVTLMIVLVVSLTGIIGGRDVSQGTGGYQLQTDSPGLPADLSQQVMANPTLAAGVAQVASAENVGRQFQQVAPGRSTPVMVGLVRAADDNLLTGTHWYFQARASGYASDRAVWDAVRTQPGTAVMLFDPRVTGISRSSPTFSAFDVKVIDPAGSAQTVHVIGLLPATTQWPFMYVSEATGEQLFGAPWHPTWWAFRVRPGVDVYTLEADLGATFGARYGMEPEVMLDKQVFAQQTLDNLNRFLTGYMALGLVVGVAALGIVAGRAVVERRQQIGMLRAIGWSRGQVQAAFLLESGFVAMLGLLAGTGAALWGAYTYDAMLNPAPGGGPLDFQAPVAGIALTLAGSYVATLASTWLPARAASRTRPADALRYDA